MLANSLTLLLGGLDCWKTPTGIHFVFLVWGYCFTETNPTLGKLNPSALPRPFHGFDDIYSHLIGGFLGGAVSTGG